MIYQVQGSGISTEQQKKTWLINWYFANDPMGSIYLATLRNPALVASYQTSPGMLYGANGAAGMETYFIKIKTHFGQSMFDQLVTEFAQQSNLYVDEITVDEFHMYGSSRLGVYESNKLISKRVARDLNLDNQITTNEYVIETPEEVTYLFSSYQLERGAKRYELANHLGNVLTVISDKKTAICTGNTFNYFAAERISATDYSPFGAPLAGRSWNGGEYRFGFNSMEKDNEINGSGNAYDFGARIYDGRLGRWMSVDPLERHYACWSTYNSFMCNPIFIIDPDGKGGKISKVRDPRTGKVVAFKVTAVIYIYSDVKSASELGELSVEIETNIEGNWNNVYSSENSVPCNYLIDGKPLIFDVEVVPITREEAVEKMNDSKTQLDENFVEIVDNTSRPSEFNYNSGVFNVCQQESDKTTYAHEFGHMLEYAIEKIKVNSDGEVINEIGDNPKLYHTKVETTYATMMRIADALDANKQRERKVTNMDVRGLDRGFGLENAIITKNLEIVKESKFIGKEKRADSYIEYKNGAKVEK